jgi:hypothetical protein
LEIVITPPAGFVSNKPPLPIEAVIFGIFALLTAVITSVTVPVFAPPAPFTVTVILLISICSPLAKLVGFELPRTFVGYRLAHPSVPT